MTQHASLFDVFNAAGRAASPFLQVETERLREKNELEARANAVDLTIKFQNYLRDTPYDPGTFNGTPEEYRAYYLDVMNKFIGQKFSNEKGEGYLAQNTSPYYQKIMSQMQAQTLQAAENIALVKEDEHRVQGANVRYEQNIKTSAELPAEQALEASDNALKLLKTEREVGPQEEYEKRKGVLNALYDKALNVNIGNLTVDAALGLLDENINALNGASQSYLAEGESLDGFLDKKQERLSNARQAVRLAVWKRNYSSGEALDNEYQRIAHDAVRTGSVSLMRAALDMWHEGSQLRETALESGEYNPDDRQKIARWFPIIDGLMGGRSGGGSGTKVKEIIQDLRDYHLSNIAEGRGNIEEEKAAFIQACGELAGGLPGVGTIDELERQNPKETNFFGMWADARKLLLERDPGYKTALESMETFIKGWVGETKDPREQALRKWQGERIGNFLFDTILDTSGPARMAPEQMQQEVLRLTGLLVTGEVAFMKETKDNSSRFSLGTDNDKDFGKATFEIAQHPEARFILQGKAYTFGDAQYMKDYEESALDKFKTITGIQKANLTTGHTKEGMYDEAAELNITVSGMGEKNGTYRFAADKDGGYWIEKQAGGEWVRDPEYTLTAKEARDIEWEKRREEHAAAQSRAEQEAARSGREATFEQIRNEEDPMRRKALADTLLHDVAPDEFWKVGINPNSGGTVTEIPADVWDRIIGKLPSSQQYVQEQQWRAKGIRKGGGK